ncbi:MAG: hypothetical protein KKF44_08555 [Nanoarchaeota archaeon]|nr:hypothetical protein [Nanoarchaeota archaeon]
MHNKKLKYKHIDLLILICFFAFNLNYLLNKLFFANFLGSEIMEFSILGDFVISIFTNRVFIRDLFFAIGGYTLLGFSLYFGSHITYEKPSFLHVLFEDFFHKHKKNKMVFSLAVFFSIIGFYLIIFKMFFEWFTLVIETPFTFAAIFAGIVFIRHRHHERLSNESLIYKASDFLMNFASSIIELIHKKSKIKYLFSFVIVLHLVTDFFSFIIPFLTGINFTFYEYDYSSTLLGMFSNDFIHSSHKISLIWIYCCILFCILVFALSPVFVWINSFFNKGINIKKEYLAIFYGALFVFMTKSIFSILPIDTLNTVGVLFSFHRTEGFYYGMEYIFIISGTLFILIWGLCFLKNIQRFFTLLGFLPIMIFFTRYLYLFIISLSNYYIQYIKHLISTNNIFVLPFALFFFCTYILFYLVGYFSFLLNMKEEMKRIS